MTSVSLGNLVRLTPLHTDELPAHPDLKDSKSSAQRPQLAAFLQAFLTEGLEFSKSFNTDFHKTGTKSSAPSSTPVDTLTLTIPGSQISKIPTSGEHVSVQRQSLTGTADAGEFWAARRSYHEDKQATGTAEW